MSDKLRARRAYKLAYYARNRAEILAKQRVYEAAHRRQRNGYWRTYRAVNREKISARRAAHRRRNPQISLKEMAYNLLNRPKRRLWRRAEYRRNIEKIRAVRRTEVAELKDIYVKNKLVRGLGISSSMIPQSLIEVKRLHLKIVRLLKEK